MKQWRPGGSFLTHRHFVAHPPNHRTTAQGLERDDLLCDPELFQSFRSKGIAINPLGHQSPLRQRTPSSPAAAARETLNPDFPECRRSQVQLLVRPTLLSQMGTSVRRGSTNASRSDNQSLSTNSSAASSGSTMLCESPSSSSLTS